MIVKTIGDFIGDCGLKKVETAATDDDLQHDTVTVCVTYTYRTITAIGTFFYRHNMKSKFNWKKFSRISGFTK